MKLKKFLHLFIILTMMSFFMFGCRNAEADTDSSTETETISAEAPETATKVYVEEETTEVEESEVVPEEEVAEEPEEVITEEPEVVEEEPVEVISVKEHADLTNYIATLDPDQPEIIIFNGVELYMIHMKEGQHYQLKPDDEIIFNCEGSLLGYGWPDVGDTAMSIGNYNILQVDYSKFEQDQEFFLKKKLKSGEIVQRTCYLTPPTE